MARRAGTLGVLLATFLLLADGTGAPWLLAAALGGVAYLVLVVRTGLLPADVMAWARQAVAQRRVVAETGSARAA